MKKNIKAALGKDLVNILKSIGEYDKLEREELRCSCCGKTLTIDDIQLIYPQRSEVKYICNSFHCIEHFSCKYSDDEVNK